MTTDDFTIIKNTLNYLGYDIIPTQDEKDFCIIPPEGVSLYWTRVDERGLIDFYTKVSGKYDVVLNVTEYPNIIHVGSINTRFYTKAEIINECFRKAGVDARAHTIGRGHRMSYVYSDTTDLTNMKIITPQQVITFYPRYDMSNKRIDHLYWGMVGRRNL